MGRFLFSLLVIVTIVQKTYENCGVRNITLLTSDVSNGEFPWQVQIRPDSGRFCSGTILSEFWIVSSANCFTETTNTILMETGDMSINTQESVSPIRRLIRHSDYNGTSLENSLALLESSNLISFNQFVMPACFPDDELLDINLFVNCLVTIVEESTQGGSADAETVLKKIRFNPTETCSINNLTDIMCATASNAETSDCMVNSGDPLMCQYRRNNAWTVVGIAALEETNCNSAVIFARTASYITWVKESTELEGKPFTPDLNSAQSAGDAPNIQNLPNNSVYYNDEPPSEEYDEKPDIKSLNKARKLETEEMMVLFLFYTQTLFIILII